MTAVNGNSQASGRTLPNPPRKHHFIPVFYTKYWAGVDGLVERFTRHREVVDRRVSPSRVGWQEDLYSIPGLPPDQTQILEREFFRQLDDVAARALQKMNSTPKLHLSDAETTAWSLFILSLLHRTPEYLAATLAAGRRIWAKSDLEFEQRYEEIRRPEDPPTFPEYAAKHFPLMVDQSTLRSLPHLIANERIAQFINDMHWLALDVPATERDLLLSDNPLVRTNGIKVAGGHIAMPLSPRRLLVAAWERDTAVRAERIPIRQLVKAMNRWTVESARHFVVATDLSQAKFIRRHFGSNPKAALNELVG